jgi:hypothetical protein
MKSSLKLLHWLPRIICILAILFVSIFALDSFAPGLSLTEQLGAFAMHLIPSFVLAALLFLAWKWELIGGVIFTLIGIAMSPVVFFHNYRINHFSAGQSLGVIMMITFPFIVVGFLFIASHNLKKKSI